ncbi:MAG: bifunctional 2-polyprenyl-6-hydroxyphenol methylase/3-demethylubiquinol 3-O-methyltransferase UbiG [Planctomycetota bacterium]
MALAAPRDSDVFSRPGWWDDGDRTYASLRAVNELRLEILGDWMRRWFGAEGPRRVVDLGCGGGLMALPLAQAGARVVAVDRNLDALRAGHDHQRALRRRGVEFVRGDLCAAPLPDGSADLVLLNDVVEHLEEPAAALHTAARLLRPGGRLFVNTINRTLRARVLAIWLGEGLGMIPRGTHRARLFVRPQELARKARAAGLVATDWSGERPLLLPSLRARAVRVGRGRSLAVGYCAGFRRLPDSSTETS